MSCFVSFGFDFSDTVAAGADAMRIVVYEGQAQRRAGKTAAVVTAGDLAAADVVLTTYEVLRRDIHQQPAASDSGDYCMRNRKKYEVRSHRHCSISFIDTPDCDVTDRVGTLQAPGWALNALY